MLWAGPVDTRPGLYMGDGGRRIWREIMTPSDQIGPADAGNNVLAFNAGTAFAGTLSNVWLERIA